MPVADQINILVPTTYEAFQTNKNLDRLNAGNAGLDIECRD